MTTEIISDVDFNDPTNLIPYLEKDDAIIRNVCKSMLDWSNTASYNGTGAPSAGTVATSLTADGQTGAAGSAWPAVTGGMLDAGGTSRAWVLPANFKLTSATKRFMAIIWAKMPASGYQTGSANVSQSLMGFMNNTSTLAQWGLLLQTVQATGLPNVLGYLTPSNGGSAYQRNLPTADTLAACDGQLHQIALYFDGESSPGNAHRMFFIDKVAKDDSTIPWDGAFGVPAAGCNVGYNTAFQNIYPTGFKLGRPSIWDLTGTIWTPAQILQRDWDAAQGYLS